MNHHLDKLKESEKDQGLDFLLNHMSMETRRHFMGTLPIAYSVMYPSAGVGTICQAVADQMKTREGLREVVKRNPDTLNDVMARRNHPCSECHMIGKHKMDCSQNLYRHVSDR